MFDVVKAVPDGRGLGIFYWEPAWIAVAGAGWENQAMFDYGARPLLVMRVFGGV